MGLLDTLVAEKDASVSEDPRDLTEQFNTPLSPEEEAAFQKWAGKKIRDIYNYDLRGAWRDISSGKVIPDERGHLPDTYKKPNHPTFSKESIYSTDDTPGGEWVEKNYKWQYIPSDTNLRYYSPQELQDYFRTKEPDVRLLLPERTQR